MPYGALLGALDISGHYAQPPSRELGTFDDWRRKVLLLDPGAGSYWLARV